MTDRSKQPADAPVTDGARTRDSDRSQQAILAAAIAEFAQHGLGGARMERIAGRAGVDKRLIYYYFDNKDSLFRVVMEETYSRIRKAESALRLGDEPEWAAAAQSLLPYRGRQAVLGTPSLTLGAYDEVLGRIAERRGDLAGAREWWRSARAQGVQVGSPHQVALADSHLTRVAAVV